MIVQPQKISLILDRLGEPAEESPSDLGGKEGLLVNILDFVGVGDRKYFSFGKQAVRDLPKSGISKQIGNVREWMADGEKFGI